MMRDALSVYGCNILLAAYNARKPLEPVLQHAADAAVTGSPNVLSGVLGAAIGIINAPHGVGFSGASTQFVGGFAGESCVVNLNIMFARRDYDGVGAMLGTLGAALEGLRIAAPGVLFAKEKTTDAEPQVTETAPMKVEVMAMPSRIRESVVTQRDSDGGINKVSQIERDLEQVGKP